MLGPPFVFGDDDVEKIGMVLETAITSAVERASRQAVVSRP